MAQVYLTRGDLDPVLGLYEESLALKEQIGYSAGQGRLAASNGAGLPDARATWTAPLGLYEESLALFGNRSATGRARPPRSEAWQIFSWQVEVGMKPRRFWWRPWVAASESASGLLLSNGFGVRWRGARRPGDRPGALP